MNPGTIGGFVPPAIAVVTAILGLRQMRRRGRERRARERAAALAPVARSQSPAAAAAAPRTAAQPSVRTIAPVARAPLEQPRGRARLRFGGAAAADAIVAAEVLGPPVALRSGGTLGPPGAF